MEYLISGIHKPNKIKFMQLEAASRANIPILTSDVRILCSRIAEDKHDATSARAAVRAYFSLIEAFVFYMKELASILKDHKELGKSLTKEEKELLKGKRFEKRRGELKEIRLPRQPFLERVKFTLKIYLKVFNIEYSIDYENEGWQKFVHASKIRHRLTHPSKIGDVDLSQEDFKAVAVGANWFLDRQKEIDRLKHEKSPLKTTP